MREPKSKRVAVGPVGLTSNLACRTIVAAQTRLTGYLEASQSKIAAKLSERLDSDEIGIEGVREKDPPPKGLDSLRAGTS